MTYGSDNDDHAQPDFYSKDQPFWFSEKVHGSA